MVTYKVTTKEIWYRTFYVEVAEELEGEDLVSAVNDALGDGTAEETEFGHYGDMEVDSIEPVE